MKRRALISGAAGGIGRATAHAFAREGADLALVDLAGDGVRELAAEIQATYPGRAIGLGGDVASESDCAEVITSAINAFDGLDILVTCAAARAYGPLADVSAESWSDVINTNLLGTQNLVKAALPQLRQSTAASTVIVSSVFGAMGRRGMGQYDATKAALISLTKTFATEEAEHGVRVNAVCPGSVWTPYTASRAKARGMTESELRETGAVPALINRWAEPEEIAAPILWLASDEASFITGTSLMVDGGLSAAISQ